MVRNVDAEPSSRPPNAPGSPGLPPGASSSSAHFSDFEDDRRTVIINTNSGNVNSANVVDSHNGNVNSANVVDSHNDNSTRTEISRYAGKLGLVFCNSHFRS